MISRSSGTFGGDNASLMMSELLLDVGSPPSPLRVKIVGVLGSQRPLGHSLVHANRHGEGTVVRERPAAAPALPEQPLGHGERCAPARRADELIVLGLAAGNLVPETQLPFHLDQILDVHARAE